MIHAQREALDAAASLASREQYYCSDYSTTRNQPRPVAAILSARLRNCLVPLVALMDEASDARIPVADAGEAVAQIIALCDALAMSLDIVRRAGAALIASVGEEQPVSTQRSAT